MASGLGEHATRQEYLTIQRNASDIVTSLAAQVDPGLFAQKLSEAGIVSEHVVQKASARDVLAANRIQDVVQAVQSQIKLDPSIYDNFIIALHGFHPLLAKKLKESLRHAEDSTECSGSDNTFSLGSTGDTCREVHPQPIAMIPGRVELKHLSDAESWDLSSKFAAMLSELIPLMNKALDVATFKLFLQLFCDVRTGQPYIEPTIYQNCTTTAGVLETLLRHHRFHPIQLSLLNVIVGRYGCDKCKTLLQEYESEIPKSAPLKRSRNELSEEEIERSIGTKRLKTQIVGEASTCTLEHVERTKEALAKSSGVNSDAIVYGNHTPGSVVLNFIIPACTVESFTNISENKEKLSILNGAGILSISVDHTIFKVGTQLSRDDHSSQTDLSPSAHKTIPSVEIMKHIGPFPSSESESGRDKGDVVSIWLHDYTHYTSEQKSNTAMEKECIAEVMEEKGVTVGEIPRETPFRPTPLGLFAIQGSRRYFECRAFAMFRAHDHATDGRLCSRSWGSARAWCVIDLKEQSIIYRYTQDCQSCEGTAEPDYEEDSVRRMAEYAVKTYLRRSGQGERRDPFDFSAMGDALDRATDGPHDAGRCQRCRMGLPCQQ